MYPCKREMESFLPSEIARLVYGYLEEEDCPGAAQAFLETSVHLKECLAVARKGRKFNTRIFGLTLVDILDLLTEAISFVKEHTKEFKEENRKHYRLLSLIQIDNLTNSPYPDSSSDNFRKNENSRTSTVQNENNWEKQGKNEEHFSSPPTGDIPQHLEAPTSRGNAIISSQNSDDELKIKEESDEEANYAMEEESGDFIPHIEPEVHISSPLSADIHSRQEAPTVNVITNPIMVSGRPAQLLCQPYNMVQMLPAPYPGSVTPNISTMYFPPNSIQHHPGMSVQPQPSPPTSAIQPTLYQTTVRTSSSNTVWPKTKVTNSQQQQNGGAKLRPIAPKIPTSMDDVKIHIVHADDTPRVKSNSFMTKRNLRSRKKPVRTIPSKNQSSSVFTSEKK